MKPHCVYCGTRLSHANVCRAHLDVARNDPQFHKVLHTRPELPASWKVATPPRGL